MGKNLTTREGFLNRNVDGLPEKKCIVNAVTNDVDGEHVLICEWEPKQVSATGLLGTLRLLEGPHKGIGFHAWAQNNSEFIYYQIIK